MNRWAWRLRSDETCPRDEFFESLHKLFHPTHHHRFPVEKKWRVKKGQQKTTATEDRTKEITKANLVSGLRFAKEVIPSDEEPSKSKKEKKVLLFSFFEG
jgi:hypothetical protein